MNNYILQNEDRIMRPVTMDDAEFIVKLRNQNHAKGFIHDTSLDIEKQQQWLQDYFKRENEYYWIVTTLEGVPYGTSSYYDYKKEYNQIEAGRWVRLPGFTDNIISSHVQMRDFAFNILGVDRIVCDIVSTNKQVLKYHQKILGLKRMNQTSIVSGVDGGDAEMIWFEETRDTWAQNRPRLLKLCSDISVWKILKADENGNYIEI